MQSLRHELARLLQLIGRNFMAEAAGQVHLDLEACSDEHLSGVLEAGWRHQFVAVAVR